MLTKEQRDEILRLVQECVAVGNKGGEETCIGWEQCNLCATCSRFTTQSENWLPLFIGSNPDYCPYYIKSPKPGDSNE